jgi:hypothetical protein
MASYILLMNFTDQGILLPFLLGMPLSMTPGSSTKI